MFRLAAEPKRWMRVTAPVAASVRSMPAWWMRWVVSARWITRNTCASNSKTVE